MILNLEKVSKNYRSRAVLSDVSLSLSAGTITGLVGPNGAGKSTLMKISVGLVRPTSGTVSIAGIELKPSVHDVLRHVGTLIERPSFYPRLTGREHVEVLSLLRGTSGTHDIDVLAKLGLAYAADQAVGTYSMGMRQRLAVALALVGDPELLILDEPSNGLDPEAMFEMRNLLQELKVDGKAILLSSHLLSDIEKVADNVVLLGNGRTVFSGSIGTIRASFERSVEITVDDLEKGCSTLIDFDVECKATCISLLGDAERVADAIRRLVMSGVSVYEVQKVHTSFEDAVLRLSRNTVDREVTHDPR